MNLQQLSTVVMTTDIVLFHKLVPMMKYNLKNTYAVNIKTNYYSKILLFITKMELNFFM
jgi:hypothetical protein